MKKLITIILCLMAITVSAQRRTYGAIRAYTNANIYRSEVKRAQLNYSTHERVRSLNHAAHNSVYRSTDYVVGMRPTRSSYIRDSYTVDDGYTSDVAESDNSKWEILYDMIKSDSISKANLAEIKELMERRDFGPDTLVNGRQYRPISSHSETITQ